MQISPLPRRSRLVISTTRKLLCLSLVLGAVGAVIPEFAHAGDWGVSQQSTKRIPSVQRMISIAGQFEKQGDYERAVNLYYKILSEHPGHLYAQKRLDLCLGELNRNHPNSNQSVAPIPTFAAPQQIPGSELSGNTGPGYGVAPAIPHLEPPVAPPITEKLELAAPPEKLPEPTIEVTELKPLSEPAAVVRISDDEWDSEPVQEQEIVIRPNPADGIPRMYDDIPRLTEAGDEPEMLSVMTHPSPLERSAPISGEPSMKISAVDSSGEGPRLTLKKLETQITVERNSQSASAVAVTEVIQGRVYEELPSPYVRPQGGIVSLDDEAEAPEIGRVGLSEDQPGSFTRTIVAPESEELPANSQKSPATRSTPARKGSFRKTAPERSRDSASGYSEDSRYSEELLDENCTDIQTPDYRTGLLSVCPRATQEIRRLIRSMETPSVRVRKSTLLRLCNMGGDARSGLPAVRELLFDPDESIRVMAAYSLWQIGRDASGMLTLTDVVVTGTAGNSCLAAYTLGEIGPSASEALPLLEHIAANGTGLMRLHAWEAVWRIKEGDDRALDAMLSFLKSGDVHERWLATYMLGNTGSKRLDMIYDLSGALDDSATIVQTGAGFALGCVGPDASVATPRLISIFETSEFEDALRVTAFEALTRIEPLTAKKFQQEPNRNRIQPVGSTVSE